MTPQRARQLGRRWKWAALALAVLAGASTVLDSPLSGVLLVLAVSSACRSVDYFGWRDGYLARQQEQATPLTSKETPTMGDVSPATEQSQAAAHIRELAAAATPGPWRPETDWRLHREPRLTGAHHAVILEQRGADRYDTVALTGFAGEHPRSAADAAHIALWHPGIAMLIADLLDAGASHWNTRHPDDWPLYHQLPIARFVRAVNACRAGAPVTALAAEDDAPYEEAAEALAGDRRAVNDD